MGILEIIFSIIIFFIVWFIAFKIMLIYDKKKPLNEIGTKIQKQDEKIFNIEGKKIRAGMVLDEEEPEEEPEEKIEPIKKKVVKKTAKKKK